MKNYVGERFGRLVVLEEVERKKYSYNKVGYRMMKCKCDCGKEVIVRANSLKKNSKSCGCGIKIKATTHGLSKTNIYRVWQGIKRRCDIPSSTYYEYYGGRGISYDTRRDKFENFYEDMKEGWRKGLTIDRVDGNGNYCKDNCKRSTMTEQNKNKSNNIYFKGLCTSELSKKFGIGRSAMSKMVNKKGIEGAVKYYETKHNLLSPSE